MFGVVPLFASALGRWLVIGLIGLVLFGYGWFRGNEHGTAKLSEYIGKQAEAAVRIVTKRGVVTERVLTKYIKVAGATKVVTQTVEKEVLKYAENNPGLCLDTEFRRLHDRASTNAVPKSAP